MGFSVWSLKKETRVDGGLVWALKKEGRWWLVLSQKKDTRVDSGNSLVAKEREHDGW